MTGGRADPVAEILAIFRGPGSEQYGNEPVTQRDHALQSAQRAADEGAPPALVAAALLHDIGHLLAAKHHPDMGQEHDDLHERVGAGWLRRRFVDAVAEPVRLHVDAKRFLCRVEPSYAASLSEASIHSLALQGDVFSAAEAAAFGGHPFAADAVRVRRWDDLAKIPDCAVAPPESYADLLRGLRRV